MIYTVTFDQSIAEKSIFISKEVEK